MAPGPRFEVDVRVTRDLRHAPYLLDGLAALERAGELRMRLRPRRPVRRDRVVVGVDGAERTARPYPWSVDLQVRDHETAEVRRVSVDLQDWREMYSYTSLRHSDVIVKRMHTAPEVATIRREFGVEVVPAGITGPGDAARWGRRWSIRVAMALGRLESAVGEREWSLEQLRRRRSAPAVPPPSRPVPSLPERFVFFQVAHHDWPHSPRALALNQARAELIRQLRSALGPQFLGGMTFAGPPVEEFADCRSDLPSDRADYLDLVGRATVVVATNGFGDSPPWKLAEYLERGACIVTEAPAVTLPRRLEHGRHAWLFADPDEAVTACRHLLSAPAERTGLEQGAADYYADQVRPEAAARRFLLAGSRVASCPA